MKCNELMKKDVVCVSEMDNVQRVAKTMEEKNVGFIPVCDGEHRAIGTLTDRDLALRVCARDLKASATKTADIMSRDQIVTCRDDEDVEVAIKRMSEKKKSRILVTDAKGKHVGVISLSDIAQKQGAKSGEALQAVSSRETKAA